MLTRHFFISIFSMDTVTMSHYSCVIIYFLDVGPSPLLRVSFYQYSFLPHSVPTTLPSTSFPWVRPVTIIYRTCNQQNICASLMHWSAGLPRKSLHPVGNLVPRVLRLFGQRDDAWRDSGIMELFKFFHWPLE